MDPVLLDRVGERADDMLLPHHVGERARTVDEVRDLLSVTDDPWQTEGVNDRVQLAAMNRELNRRVAEKWMRSGVTMIDPATTFIDVTVVLERDVVLRPGVQLRGATEVAHFLRCKSRSPLVHFRRRSRI